MYKKVFFHPAAIAAAEAAAFAEAAA